MKITVKDLRSAINSRQELERAGLSFQATLLRVRRYYCNQLTIANRCPKKCHECTATLQGVIQRIIETPDVRISEAMLTTQLRIAAGNKMETPLVKVKPLVDRFGDPTHESAFHALEELFA